MNRKQLFDIKENMTMGLSAKEKELVAIGASIAGNCIPCLQWHYKKCIELGFSKEEMHDAFEMAKKVKEVPNNKIYEAAAKLNQSSAAEQKSCSGESGCCG